MDDRALEKELENRLKGQEAELPEALLPENMKRRWENMSEEEKTARSESVPEDAGYAETLENTEAADAVSTANAENMTNTVNTVTMKNTANSADPVNTANAAGAADTLSTANSAGAADAAPASGSGKKKGIARFVFPALAAAASLFLAFELGVNMDAIRDRISAPAAESLSADAGRKAVKDQEADTEQEAPGKPGDDQEAAPGAEKPESGKEEIPETDVKDGESSGYGKAYQHLNAIREEQNRYYTYDMPMVDYVEEAMEAPIAAAESADAFVNSAPDMGASQKEAASPDTAAAGAAGVDFTDTNVRTEGVAEGDIIKTDGNYIYEYDDRTEHIRIYRIGRGDFEEISSINLLKDMDFASELFINGDRLVIMGSTNDIKNDRGTVVSAIYDVSDRKHPKRLKDVEQDGRYHSARVKDGFLYTFSRYNVRLEEMEEKDYKTYIPETDGDLIPEECVLVPEDCNTTEYFVITGTDLETGKPVDRRAILAGGDLVYVSTDSIFLTDRQYNWDSYGYSDLTNLIRFSYKDGSFRKEAEGFVPGYLNDYYSIDEYNGYVRLVTTYEIDWTTYNGLYILDEDLERVSVIKKLAEGETVKSARFMGDTAYFVTFRTRDPLFSVDLSDPENPEIMGYLKIPGFSAYLHPYDETHLLGIGYDADERGWEQEVKLTMFDVSDPSDVIEEDTKLLRGFYSASVLENPKALMFDAKRGVFGFSLCVENPTGEDDDSVYQVYTWDNGFEKLLDYGLKGDARGNVIDVRGLIADGYLYVIKAGGGITSFDTEGYDVLKETMR